MQRVLIALGLVLVIAANANAQISIPNSFTANTRIVSADVNANFTELGTKSLNRTGGTATGDIVFATKIVPDADGGADIGTAALQFNIGYFEDLEVETVATVGALHVDVAAAGSIVTVGGIVAGSGVVQIVDSDGRIPAISSTYFASLSGANLTGIPTAALSDAANFAHINAAETVTAQWIFTPSAGATLWDASSATSNAFAIRGRASDEQSRILFLSNTGASNFGAIQGDTDTISVLAGAGLGAVASFSPATANISVSGNLNFAGASITNSGYYTSADLQPGFFAYTTAESTAVANNDTVPFGTELFDTAGNFASNTFTAPVTGIYHLCAGASVLPSGTGIVTLMVRNTSVPAELFSFTHDFASIAAAETMSGCGYASLTAAQTVVVRYSHNGTDGASIRVNGNFRDTYFTGRLVP